MHRKMTILLLSLLLAMPLAVQAGWLSEAVNEAVENTGRRKVQEKVDEAADAVDEKAHNAGQKDDQAEEKSAPASKKMAKPTEVAAAEEQSGEEAQGGEADGDGEQGEVKASTEGRQGKGEITPTASAAEEEKVYRNYDFIPGDKIIFYDDFSDTDVGEFPPRWTLEGPSGGGGAVEVVQVGDKKFFHSRTSEGDWGQDSTTIYLRLKDLKDLPKKFTIEFDAILGSYKGQQKIYGALMVNEESEINYYNPGQVYFTGGEASSKSNKSQFEKSDGKLHHISIMVNGTFMKAYVDGDRVINDPDAIVRPITHVGICLWPEGANQQDKLMFTNFRLAEGGKDIPKALETDGRIVTHGIQFDTGSDKIRPESYSTLKAIYDLLVGDPKLKFKIEGHTDSQGGSKVNQPLSEKRAAAVKTWLTKKGIDSGRLTTAGFGDSKPLSKNDTAEGRANNRRVEFAKL